MSNSSGGLAAAAMVVRSGLAYVAMTAIFAASWSATAQASTWSGGDGTWVVGNPGWDVVPNAVGAVANNPITATGITTQSVAGTQTVGTINLSGADDFAWTIATGTNSITLNQDGASAGVATILNSNTSTGATNALILTGLYTLADRLLIENSGGSTNGTGAIQISGVMSGTVSGVTFRNVNSDLETGFGYIRLTGANTFSAPVLIQKGVTQITTATGLGNAANIVTIGDASGGGQGSAALVCSTSVAIANPIVVASGSGGTLSIGGGTGTTSYTGAITLNANLNIDTNSTNVAGTLFSGLISGAGGLNLPAGTGNVRLSNANSNFTGGVTVNGGTLNINNSTDTTDPNTYTKGPLGKGTLTLSGGKIDTNSSAAANTIANPIFVTPSTSTIITSITNNITFNGPISGSGTLLFDSGNSSHTTTITLGGSLAGFTGTIEHFAYNTSGGTGNSMANTLLLNGAAVDASTVKFNLHGVQNRSSGGRAVRFDASGSGGIAKMGELAGDGGFILANNGPVNLEVGALNSDTTYAGSFGDIGSSALSLTKVGTGSLTLTNISGFYTGTTTVRAGALVATDEVDTVSVPGQLAISGWNTGTETMTTGAPHGLSEGDTVKFGTQPTGTNQSSLYYVLAAGLSATDFRVSLSPGGTPVNLTGTSAAANVYHVSTLGGTNSAIQLGDAGSTTADPITLRFDAGKLFARPISVNATTGASTTTIGGGTDENSTFSGAITLAKNLSITSAASGANSVNITGAISGPGFAITKVGSGNVTFSANNTYGATTVSEGSIIVGAGGTTGTLGSGAVTNNGALVFNRSNALVIANAIGGSGSVEQLGTGTTSLTSANNYSGTTTVTAGILSLDHSGGNLGSLSGSSVGVSAGGTLLVKGSTSIGGGGSLSLAASGALDMRDTAINSLTIGGNLNLDSNAVMNLNLGSSNGSNDSISVGGTVVPSGASTLNIYGLGSLASGATNYTLISAPGGGLTAGGSDFTLGVVPAGFNTYSLSTSTSTALKLTVNANATPGTAYWTGLASSAGSPTDPSNNWGYGSGLAVQKSNWSTTANGLTDPLQVPGSTTDVIFTASNASGTALSTQLDAAYGINSLTFNTSSAAAITSVDINTNAFGLTLGSGGLAVASANTSNTTISGTGQVLIGASQNWANNSATKSLTVSANVNGTAVGSTQILTLNGVGAAGATLSGAIGNGSGLGGQLALVFSQSGTTKLSGNNTFTGGVTINSGTVQANHAGALNSTTPNTVAFGAGSTGVLQINGNSLTVGGLSTNASVGTPVVENANASSATLTANVAAGTSTYAGVLRDGSGGGSLSLAKSGAGILALTGSNTYSGATTVAGGVLRATDGVGLPATTGLTLAGGVWETNANITRTSGAGGGQVQLTGGASGFSANGAPVNVNLGGSAATLLWGDPAFDPAALVLNDASADSLLDFQNGIDLNGANRTINVNSAGSAAKISGVLSGTGGLSKGGGGTLILATSNTFIGTTGSSGALQLNDSLALQNSTVTGTGIIFDQSVATNTFTFGNLTGGTTLALENNAGSPAPVTLQVGGNNANTISTTNFTGAGTLVKNGTGSLQINITNSTNTGGTTLNSGTLNLRFGTDTENPATYSRGPVGHGVLTLNGGTLANVTGDVVLANPINVTANTTVNGSSNTNFLTLTGPITGTARMTTNNGTTAATIYAGDISGFAGEFRITGSGTRLQFLGTTAASLNGSQASFRADSTAASAGQLRFGVSGTYNNPTIKMGSLSGTDAAALIVANGQIGKATFEIGAKGLNDSFFGNFLPNSGTSISISKVGVGTLTFGAADPTPSADDGSSYVGTTDISDGTFKAGNATALGANAFENASTTRGNAYGASVPTMQTTNAGTNVTGTGTLDLNGLTFNEVITLNSQGIGGIGGLINSNTSSPATVGSGVAFIQIASGGSGYTGALPTTVAVTGGDGTGAAVLAATTGATPLALGLTTASVTSVSGGSGFAIGDVIRLSGTGFNGAEPLAQVTTIGGTGNITGIAITNAGNGFTAAATITGASVVSSATGSATGVTVGINPNNFTVSSLKLSDSGTGYTSAPTITVSGGGAAVDATATALLSEVKLAGNSSIGGDGTLNIDAVVSGIGSLTKVGLGTTTLSGANTYAGDTIVQAGILSINKPYLSNVADVYLTTGAALDLNFPVGTPDTIDSLFIDNAMQTAGVTWGAPGSGAVRETPLITNTGLLLIGILGDYNDNGQVDAADYVLWRKNPANYGGASGYNVWRANFGATAGSGSGSSLGESGTVPEPGIIILAMIGGLGLTVSRRRVRTAA